MKDKLMGVLQEMLTVVVEGDLSDPATVKQAVELADKFIETVDN